MAVVAAGMHFSRILGLISGGSHFFDVNGIHVSSQANHFFPVAHGKICNNARTANTFMDSAAHSAQLIGNKTSRFDFFKGRFWVGMKSMPPRNKSFLYFLFIH